MLVVGLTGNIGSGKTLISGIFRQLGIPVYMADAESKKFLQNADVIAKLVAVFGSGILDHEKSIDRKSLATIVFNDPEKLKLLNSILHPKVMEDFKAWTKLQTAPYIIQEAAIIYESGLEKDFHRIIHVSCPKEIAINRVMQRDQVDGNSVLERMKFQLTDEQKSRLADHVIINDGAHLVIPQVLQIHHHLLKISP